VATNHEDVLVATQHDLALARRALDEEKERHDFTRGELARMVSLAQARRNASVREASLAGMSNTKIAHALGMSLPAVAHILKSY
jgi:hypothetical protein